MFYRVLRSFSALGRVLEAGEVVDTSDTSKWRPSNVQGLVSGRYLELMPLRAHIVDAVMSEQAAEARRGPGRPRKEPLESI